MSRKHPKAAAFRRRGLFSHSASESVEMSLGEAHRGLICLQPPRHQARAAVRSYPSADGRPKEADAVVLVDNATQPMQAAEALTEVFSWSCTSPVWRVFRETVVATRL